LSKRACFRDDAKVLLDGCRCFWIPDMVFIRKDMYSCEFGKISQYILSQQHSPILPFRLSQEHPEANNLSRLSHGATTTLWLSAVLTLNGVCFDNQSRLLMHREHISTRHTLHRMTAARPVRSQRAQVVPSFCSHTYLQTTGAFSRPSTPLRRRCSVSNSAQRHLFHFLPHR
jgi:hypothetical protein